MSRLIADGAGEADFTRPGHLVTLRYTEGGVRERRGHTECAVGTSPFLFSTTTTRLLQDDTITQLTPTSIGECGKKTICLI